MAGTIESPAPVQPAPLRAPRSSAATSSRRKKVAERFFIVPGETEWELWAGTDPLSAHLVETVKNPRADETHSVAAVALPAREVVTQPLWLATTDRSLLPEMVALQCEKRGILNRARAEAVYDFSTVAQEGSESLVLAQLLSLTLSPDICSEQAEQFDLACRFTSLPEHALVITRELGELAVALTRQKNLVYYASLGEERLSESVISRLLCLLSLAQTERWITAAPEIVLRGNFNPADENALRSALGLRVRREEHPVPWPPGSPSKLTPHPVQEALLRRRKRARFRQQVSVIVGIYLAAIIIWAGYVGWLAFQARTLQTRVTAVTPEVTQLRSTALRWEELQPAINPTYYPLEVLYRCVSLLPKEGVRITFFETRGNKILLSGESKGTNAFDSANTYFNDIKTNKELNDFNWNMPQPNIRENGCKFQIEGTRLPGRP